MTRSVRAAFVLALVLAIAGLTGCGGGGGGDDFSPPLPPVEPPPPPPVEPPEPVDPVPPEPVDPVDPVDPEPADPTEPPDSNPPAPPLPQLCESGAVGVTDPSSCARGRWAVPGIDQIPLEHVRVTNAEMRKMFVILDSTRHHGHSVGRVACESYITAGACHDPAHRVGKIRHADGTVTESGGGSVPFTHLIDETDEFWYPVADDGSLQIPWFEEEITQMGTVKMAVRTIGGTSAPNIIVSGRDLPYLIVHSAGNGGGNISWFSDLLTPARQHVVHTAIAANKLIFVAGWDRDAAGNYIRHTLSDSCRDVDDGCIWAQFHLPGWGGGTSYSAPQFASALASVLAVFPDTSPDNLAAFGKSCAKKTGEGIEALLAESGGLGVADFHCMGDVISALVDLPIGDVADVTVNGERVQVGGRRLSIPFSAGTAGPVLAGVPEGGSVRFVPNGRDGAALSAVKRAGKAFVAGEVGTRDNFFGFREWHEAVVEARLSAGHENLFMVVSEQHSIGAGPISNAHGRSVAFIAREDFALSEDTIVVLSAGTERFLGGGADISAGSVRLDRGEWDHRFSLSSATALDETKTVGFGAVMRAPEGRDEEFAVGANFNWRF